MKVGKGDNLESCQKFTKFAPNSSHLTVITMNGLPFIPEERYMRRALQLAAFGAGHVSPNPMVGAVIVADGRIIGEGWHRKYGEAHAEVNAVNSVRPVDMHLLPESTIYVTLEPCSHYGKTPPCALLLVNKRIPRVVVGCADPFVQVRGRGIKMIREAGFTVIENFLEEECRWINRRFITANTLGRPYIQLKWAQTANGVIGGVDNHGRKFPLQISTPVTNVLMHKERAMADAILVGTGTVTADNPSLSLRGWPGRQPAKISFASDKIPADAHIREGNFIQLDPHIPLLENLVMLHETHKINSIMVEGGATLLQSFIESGLYDEIRVETNPKLNADGIPAPSLPVEKSLLSSDIIDGNRIDVYIRQFPL